MNWIKVKEKSPNKYGPYLVCTLYDEAIKDSSRKYEFQVVYWCKGDTIYKESPTLKHCAEDYWNSKFYSGNEELYWMPLPEEPKQ